MAVDIGSVTLEQLRRKNPERDKWEARWSDYRLAYRGGDEFLRAAGQASTVKFEGSTSPIVPSVFDSTPRRRFLRQLEGEPNAVYSAIWERAEYVNYLSAILDYFRQWLFNSPPTVRPREGEEAPDWYEEFERDCTGAGVGFVEFLKDVFLDVLIERRAGWMICNSTDDPSRVTLKKYTACEINDWECDAKGELLWVVLHRREQRREFPGERREVEIYTYADREIWAEWEVVRGEENSVELRLLGAPDAHGLGAVPFVMLEIPHGLWITDKLFSWQIGLFNQWVRLKSAMLLGCVMQPYIVSSAQDARSRIIGEGVMMELRPADAVGNGAEDFGWKSPDVSPVKFIWEQYKEAKDEGYRIIHQMSLAVDSNSVGAIARSGASKIEDRRSSEVILKGFGSYVRPVMRRTLDLVSAAYGDGTVWTLDGFDNFQVSTLDEELTQAALAQSLGLKSATGKKRLELNMWRSLLPYEDVSTMATIEKETDEAYEQEAERAAMMPTPIVPIGKDEPEEKEDAEDEGDEEKEVA